MLLQLCRNRLQHLSPVIPDGEADQHFLLVADQRRGICVSILIHGQYLRREKTDGLTHTFVPSQQTGCGEETMLIGKVDQVRAHVATVGDDDEGEIRVAEEENGTGRQGDHAVDGHVSAG